MIRLEPRSEPSAWLTIASPIIALGITVALGVLLFVLLGKDALSCLEMFFVEPIKNGRAIAELSLKVTPLLLIGLGLSLCFRSNVWNIGAEGQFILGTIFATWVALRATPESGAGRWLALLLAGALGGGLWAAVTALLRDRCNASEILVSLMLVYVAEQLLGYLVNGPWKDPNGYNFPQTITFLSSARIPRLIEGTRANIGVLLALVGTAAAWLFMHKSYTGYRLDVAGLAPAAARYAGFSARGALWLPLLVSGALSGLAGALEVAGPDGQLTTHVPLGYGFAAIIVAFVGRLDPLGVTFSSILMSMFFIGGELSQSRLGLPKSITGVFQGLLLFSLLSCDTFVKSKLRFALPAASKLPSKAALDEGASQ
ncbi:MAG TPA: ABC transporter permease [Polyangiaceae bacterium]|nr:ABC transporter permease [Polyangiaceae bacterium]